MNVSGVGSYLEIGDRDTDIYLRASIDGDGTTVFISSQPGAIGSKRPIACAAASSVAKCERLRAGSGSSYGGIEREGGIVNLDT